MHGRNVIAKVSGNVDVDSAAIMPGTSNLFRTVRRARANTNTAKMASNLTDLIIPDRFKNVADEPFLLYDSGPGNRRILYFATQRNLNYLNLVEVVLIDGTFNIVPPMFEQLYTMQSIDMLQ